MKSKISKAIRLLTFNYFLQRKKKNQLYILMFHQVNNKSRTFYPAMPEQVFKEFCSYFSKHFDIILPSQIESHFKNSNKSAAIISFDDGHKEIRESVYNTLSELGVSYNVNIDTEILETGKPQDFVRVYDILNNTDIKSYQHPEFMTKPITIDRNNPIVTENKFTKVLSELDTKDKRKLVEHLAQEAGMKEQDFSDMLTEEDVKFLSSKNVEFGSHSHTHSIFTEISNEQLEYEMQHSKSILENLTGKEIKIIAYPNGKYDDNVTKKSKEIGFDTILETDDQINHMTADSLIKRRYKRINQYHQNVDDALAHTFGIIESLKRIVKK